MRVPVTIFSGYLGAGKTTLINRLLREDHGLRLAILVNDFGAINIDETLIKTKDEGVVALQNGCVCCDLSQELGMSLNGIMTRADTPDHILIEASGVADPVSIANAASNDARLTHGGVVTVVDGPQLAEQIADDTIGAQVKGQVAAADLVLVNKVDALDDALEQLLSELGARTPAIVHNAPLAQILLDMVPLPRQKTPTPHPAYVTWRHQSDRVFDRMALGEKLASRPKGMYRLKGFVLTNRGAYEVHAVGRNVEAKRVEATENLLVALGPKGRVTTEEIESWWTAE
ncbi:Putative metal chaperone YciC [Tritonibacter multivorans]|uniref:Putative metal chaperone YciC n=1 Tax=Tritonibacter multivorans TaxID=928856 RepID=A0A0P1GD22_9RHOB|nr:CobW family GTP-binding protein [Tritonibacter multivorans]CUH79192.1 Putative metal chaperone YciC [Tritonibacter multivorans]SFC15616.1 GTPase, G3E family [Tritonibacter multivorans]